MQATEITKETPVGKLAAEAPATTRVFARHGIDYCCGGGVALGAACEARGVAFDGVLAELTDELTAKDTDLKSWVGAPLEELIDHIIEAFHRPLEEELPRIDGMLRKVFEVHGDKDPERLAELVNTFSALKAELEQHMLKEERILFPLIRQGQGAMAGGPVHVMRLEHDGAGEAIARLRALTDDFTPPAEACTTWRALYHALAEFEEAMHTHIHLENNVLFPSALGA
ncbi:MAG: iron-sulfur cluster repair di-iron protein [Planctomycetota bacterium]|nr:iron-sulfur cluster repair di-iron protein [Planctomycetota bacterium]